MNYINNINKNYDIIVVGSGFSGSVIAQQYAKENKKVLIIEKRDHIAGNMYDFYDDAGILIHKYGPHIFHTAKKHVFEYLSQFTSWSFYEHRVLGFIDKNFVPLPFNFKAIDKLFPNYQDIKKKLISKYGLDSKITIFDLQNTNDSKLLELGEYIFEKVFLNYTIKQWGISPQELDKNIIKRVPINISYDDRYFRDLYQFMPSEGYTKLFKNMLQSKNIDIILNKDASKLIDIKNNIAYFGDDKKIKKIYYSGPIDELFLNTYESLSYRSLEFVFQTYNQDRYQDAATINYPNDYEYTRITEFKGLTQQKKSDITTIVKEYPMKYTKQVGMGELPYYPILKDENIKLFNLYKQKADQVQNLILVGRLGEYKYFNMDDAVDNALKIFEKTKD